MSISPATTEELSVSTVPTKVKEKTSRDQSKNQNDILEQIFGKRQKPRQRFEPRGFKPTHPLRDLILRCMPGATEAEIQEEIQFVEACKLGNWEFDHLWCELNTHRLKAKAEILKVRQQKKFRREMILRFMVQILNMVFALAWLLRKLYEQRYLQPQIEPVWNTSISLSQSKASDARNCRWRNHPEATPPPYESRESCEQIYEMEPVQL